MTATPYDWVLVSGVPSQETSIRQGRYSLGLLGVSSEMKQRIPLEHELMGETLTLTGWVKGKVAAAPKLRISVGGTNTDSATVAVDDTAEKLTVSVAIVNEEQPIWVHLINNDGVNKAYFDALRLSSPNGSYLVPMSDAFASLERIYARTAGVGSGMPWVELEKAMHRTNGYARLERPINDSQYLRLVGRGVWPELLDGDDQIDLNADQAAAIAIRAGLRLMAMAKGSNHQSDTAQWAGVEADLLRDESIALAKLSRPAPLQRTQLNRWR